MKILIFCFMGFVTYASDLCVMLSPVEEGALIRAQERACQVKDSATLRLDGIIYTHQESWTIWLNGRSIKAGESVDTLHILKVTPESVEVIWNPKLGQRHQISLKPNEIFHNISALP